MPAAEGGALAGVEFSEWIAVEDGFVPADLTPLHSMAAVLEVDGEMLQSLAAVSAAGRCYS